MILEESRLPLVSIVMPTYNHAKYLPISVQSVLDQTFTNWELIIVDNFSNDNTLEVLSGFTDTRIKILQINNEGCIGKSRNMAINCAKSDWLAFLDSDDSWEPNKLEVILGHQNEEFDFFYHNLRVVDADTHDVDSIQIRSRKLNSPILKDLIINGNTIATSSVVVRRNIILNVGGMSEKTDLIGIEDYNTWLRISLITEKFKLIPAFLGSYRKHNSNHSTFENFRPPLAAIEEFFHLLSPVEMVQLYKNFEYLKVRTKFLNKNFENLRVDLLSVIRTGSCVQKLKALSMLTVVVVTLK
jgi:glycosyltransferase involved in cell wall biosynthesis